MAELLSDKFTNQGLNEAVQRDEVNIEAEKRKYDDEAALKILKQDLETGEADKIIVDFTQIWTISDQLLHSPWLNSYFFNPSKANVPRYTLSNILDVVVNKVVGALFFDEQPFELLPNEKYEQATMWAKSAVAATQLREMEFDVECEKGWFQCGLIGTQIYKYGWLDDTKKVPVFEREEDPKHFSTPLGDKSLDTPQSEKFKMTYKSKDIHRPWLKWRDARYLVCAPTWKEGDIRKCPWLCDTDYVTFDEIDDLREMAGYDIPERAALETLFFPPTQEPEGVPGDITETRPAQMRMWLGGAAGREVNDSADPLARKLRIIERWDAKKVTVALQNKHGYLLIRNEEHDFGAVPYLSSNWRNLPACGYGQGLGQLVGPDQQIEKGVLCAYLDILAFIARPTYVREKGINEQNQAIVIDLGKIMAVETGGKGVRDAFAMLEQPRIDPALVAAIEAAKISAANTSGANELVGQGNTASGQRATGMRSGSGAQLVGQAQAGRLDGPMERFIRQVFIPWLYIMDELNAKRLPTRTLNEILEADAEHDYEGFDHIAWRNARVQYDVLAGSHLGARKQMAEFMPFLQQMINTPAFMQAITESGERFDANTFVKFWAQLAGVRYGRLPFFRKETDDEKQQRQQNSPAAIEQKKQQGAMQMQELKGNQDQQKVAAEGLSRAAEKTIQLLAQHTMGQGVGTEGEIGGEE